MIIKLEYRGISDYQLEKENLSRVIHDKLNMPQNTKTPLVVSYIHTPICAQPPESLPLLAGLVQKEHRT